MADAIRIVVPHNSADEDILALHLTAHEIFTPMDRVEIRLASTDDGNYSRACNEGCEDFDGLLVLLNDDTVPGPDWLERLEADIALVEASGHEWGLLGARCDVISGAQALDSGNPLHEIRACPRIVTAAAAIRSEVFELAGGFDEDFPFWYSDDALSKRILDVGYVSMIGTWYMRHLGSVGSTRRRLNIPSHNAEFAPLFGERYGSW